MGLLARVYLLLQSDRTQKPSLERQKKDPNPIDSHIFDTFFCLHYFPTKFSDPMKMWIRVWLNVKPAQIPV